MKGLIFKVVVMLLITIGISNYILYIKTGKSPFNSELITNVLNSSEFELPSTKSLPKMSKQKAYKWIDKDGTTHYSSEAPTENVEATVLEVDPQQNIIQSVEVAVKEETPASPQAQTAPIANPYNPETIHKLMNDAKGVQEKLNSRYEALEKAQ
ncbi:DUF4124 domain-containing protein [Agaribacterium sp. ZY112]|uniref:DUF4124 domain-containing protein n=1 Tax=Agaribacterium sp. ZY112 TaxID=3233574 RepID=UPI003524897F